MNPKPLLVASWKKKPASPWRRPLQRCSPGFLFLAAVRNEQIHPRVLGLAGGSGPAGGDTVIEKYFDMSVVLIPVEDALSGVGTTITSMETVGALMAACSVLQ
jgi:hypothetical protein